MRLVVPFALLLVVCAVVISSDDEVSTVGETILNTKDLGSAKAPAAEDATAAGEVVTTEEAEAHHTTAKAA
ncbi:unnamed protein product [Angiostrongylus costaricensis]|uniref:Secreted protein n=1 Tax=Angiostrongylus costaricensis TaxID=334426 RepID=A0A0R3PSC3_ANGCS|nr:unnamed protein product [Angiostrongylus costaricensis]